MDKYSPDPACPKCNGTGFVEKEIFAHGEIFVTNAKCGVCTQRQEKVSGLATSELQHRIADVRSHIERRIAECLGIASHPDFDSEDRYAAAAVHKELTEVLAMLDRVQPGGAG